MPAIITENDVSMWRDKTGNLYHFPKRYRPILMPGTPVIYYKGRLREAAFGEQRLAAEPHYFGVARIGNVYPDKASAKGDLFALIEDFKRFEAPVFAKQSGEYLEPIPASRASNYWRDGVRYVDPATFNRIRALAHVIPSIEEPTSSYTEGEELQSALEGDKTVMFGVRYERNAALRQRAIAIHGVTCQGCGFNFEAAYGEYAKGFIHVHHIQPLSSLDGQQSVNPETDLIPLCANCHAVVHRRQDKTLSLEALRQLIRGKWVCTEEK